MFDKSYDIMGKHAVYTRFLSKDLQNKEKDKDKIGVFGSYGLFERYLDVYLNGALFGLLYNRTAQRDTSTDHAHIPATAFNTSRNDCVFLYRLVMLLEQTTSVTSDERINRAFKDDADETQTEKLVANMNLFHSYVLGGIEVLYEKFTDGCTTPDDYLERIFTLMESFQEEIQGISYEEKLKVLIN
jgi:hypothetical protein